MARRLVQFRTQDDRRRLGGPKRAPSGGRLRFSLDDLKGSNEVAYDTDAVLMLRPLDTTRRRLAMDFLAMRHLPGEAPEGLQLVRQGLTFELTEGPSDELEEAIVEVLRDHIKAGGEKTWRACAQEVRKAGLSVRNDILTTIRKRVMEGMG